MAAIAAACKPLQTLLGEWHDTVVQLNLLDELPPAAVHTELAALIFERQAALLSRIRNSPAPDQPVW
jgi:CHAD domain-containing protein